MIESPQPYWPAQTVALRGHEPLLLNGERGVYLLVSGQINTFCVDGDARVEGGGRRHFLMQHQAGDIVLGLPPISGHRVIAVGTLDATVAYVGEALSHLDSLPADLSARLLQRWWQQLAAAAGAAANPISLLTSSLTAEELATRGSEAAAAIATRLAAGQSIRLAALDETWRGTTSAVQRSLGSLAGVLRDERRVRSRERHTLQDSALVVVARIVAAASHIDLHLPPNQTQINQLDELLDGLELNTRRVLLRDEWWRQDNGPLIASSADDRPLALLPNGQRSGYDVFDPSTGRRTAVDAALAETLNKEATMLYRRLPDRPLSGSDLWQFGSSGIRRDALRMLALGLAAAVLAALTPVATGLLIESVIPRAAYAQHWQLVAMLLAAAIGAAGFEMTKGFALLRMEGKVDANLQAALFDRLLRLPVGFFKRFTAGDLGERTLGVQAIRETLSVTVTTALLAALFSLASLVTMFWYSWKLSLIGVLIVLIVLIFSAWLALYQLREEREQIRNQGTVEGMVLQFIIGVTKLRAAAAESRAFAAWADVYQRQKRRFSNAQRAANVQELVQSCVPLLASILLFAGMVWLLKQAAIDLKLENLASSGSQIARPTDEPGKLPSAGDMLAFNAAFGQFLQAMIGMTLALTRAVGVIPLFERLRPLLRELPEGGRHRQAPGVLHGKIEFADVSFRYLAEGPPLLDRVSLRIEAGQFVAIVGPSGSGKSTLMRLMMGFELPQSGEIFFDGKPLAGLDMAALRRAIGVVLQSGRIGGGSVFSNIAGSARISQQAALDAARQVGLDADIEAMPMGLHTVLQEGGATLSGGQRQRLLLARALVHRPAILLLDEATSALDNKTQAIVMDSLNRLDITRVVIAHRLSTIRGADQIIVVKDGRIVESGNYENLMAANGTFAELARRQLL